MYVFPCLSHSLYGLATGKFKQDDCGGLCIACVLFMTVFVLQQQSEVVLRD